ncbi:MAG: aspartate--tRNA ligase [Armatimonadetes bacterium]|jgi:aspartyl-tRNA synthetase|nr:aspartate--tRNA ligase [Armatimonadota bacterium]
MFTQRTKWCGEILADTIGETVTVNGWVQKRRDHGGVIFIDLRDRSGVVQAVFNEDSPEAHRLADQARPEYVLSITGKVRQRPEGTVNPAMPTGEVEILGASVEILNPSRTPPFMISDETIGDEILRLKYRYLDLRRPSMQANMILRHKVIQFMRQYLSARDFIEVETPILIKSTPEGARDYLVPARLYPGHFYALPQSPQQLKQLLMVAGMERYFQIAKCFRDEDPRADRQPEFTQLDLEMSFVTQDDVLNIIEGLYTEMIPAVSDKQINTPFMRLTYAEAMDKYGVDKPDLRFGLELTHIGDIVRGCGFRVFEATLESGGHVKALRWPGGAAIGRAEIDRLTDFARAQGAKGLVSLQYTADGVKTPSTSMLKFITDEHLERIRVATGAEVGDMVLVVADTPPVVAKALGALRLEAGRRNGLMDPNKMMFAWVVDFPMFEWDEKTGRWDAAHHPFTSVKDEDLHWLDTDPGKARANAYDLVCNGAELASGSIRIHRSDVQSKIFDLMGYDEASIQERFGHIIEAFQYGAPPHGGIAPGIDRTLMLLLDTDNIREVMAFPKTTAGQDPMTGAPSPVDEAQLKELSLSVIWPEE